MVFMHLFGAFIPMWLAISISGSLFWLMDTYFWSYFSWLAKSGSQNFKLAGNTFPLFPSFWSPGPMPQPPLPLWNHHHKYQTTTTTTTSTPPPPLVQPPPWIHLNITTWQQSEYPTLQQRSPTLLLHHNHQHHFTTPTISTTNSKSTPPPIPPTTGV